MQTHAKICFAKKCSNVNSKKIKQNIAFLIGLIILYTMFELKLEKSARFFIKLYLVLFIIGQENYN
jgi:hypothetical protein